MNRVNYYDDIQLKLTNLISRIEMNGSLNLLHLNIHAEAFFRDFLNKLLNLKLENANNLEQNIEAIDLIDNENKVIVQVTSTCTLEKINSTLKKDILDKFQKEGYTLRFLFLKISATSFTKSKIKNIHNINFDSDNDILDLKGLCRVLIDLPTNKLIDIKELIDLDLSIDYESTKITSNLTMVINSLAEQNLRVKDTNSNLHEFNIENKVEFNNLLHMKRRINRYKIYYSQVDSIYREYDQLGSNRSLSVFDKLNSFYEEALIACNTSGEVFLKILNETKMYIMQSENYVNIPDEELEVCISIIVVDAFIRCEIFENPEGYTHVIT
ncbi:ABC-three component system protein [Solibacillus sp. FSL R5-0449]|uniref:ABC-three component system protein n=1 Tax=Solibacillus sp. FSL R5-0449 TaxID=2921639 RepID=UPI0030D3883C